MKSENTIKKYNDGLIGKGHKDKHFKFASLSGRALSLFEDHLHYLSSSQKSSAKRSLFYFEIFLRLVGKNSFESLDQFKGEEFLEIQRLFLGALYSRYFISNDVNDESRVRLAMYFFRLLKYASRTVQIDLLAYDQISTEYITQQVAAFNQITIITKPAEELHSRYVVDISGGRYRIRISELYRAFGSNFVKKIHDAAKLHALTQKSYSSYSDLLSRFNDFIASALQENTFGNRLTEENLKKPEFVFELFWDYQRWHFECYVQRNVKQPLKRVLGNLQAQWNRILIWAKDLLVAHDIIASPLSDIWPTGNKKLARYKEELGHHRYADGNFLISQKLLTQVPLNVTDEEASEILFKKIKADFDVVKNWSYNKIQGTQKYYDRLKDIDNIELEANFGKERSTFYKKPLQAMNAIVAYIRKHHQGFLVMTDSFKGKWLQTIPGITLPVSDVALNMALPTKYTIMPFAIYLVCEHPVLTESALLECELYNKNSKVTGLYYTDAGALLIVQKNRKGAQQEVFLNERTRAVVEFLIQITEPVRQYLKSKGDDGWRRLFIVAGGQGFQEPYVFSNQISSSKILRQKEFLIENKSELGDLAEVISMARVRSTAGVLIYLETLSMEKMATALGNSARVALLHYLPPTIYQFFQERWIRIFQNMIIVHALEGSVFLTTASDFKTLAEVDEFLSKHSFSLRKTSDLIGSSSRSRQNDSEVVISLNENLLGVLLSLKFAVENAASQVNGLALYWCEFAKKLESHIESEDFPDPFIRKCLDRAKSSVNLDRFSGIIYEQ